ncbi:MAG TPA: hypothetical protein VGH28_29325 [Polyangiaceae bacterium]|jgi:hypothetical protein
MRGEILLGGALVATLLACGGPGSKTPTPPTDAGADATPPHVVSTLPTDVRNPPPFHLESKHVTLRDHPDWAACHADFHAAADPSKALAALGAACASATKMHAEGAPLTGSQNATSSQPVSYAFHARGHHCYRLYGIAGNGVKSLVAVLSDPAGAAVAEYHSDDVSAFIAPDEAMCFADDVDVKITVSIGIGDGPYALQVWSD